MLIRIDRASVKPNLMYNHAGRLYVYGRITVTSCRRELLYCSRGHLHGYVDTHAVNGQVYQRLAQQDTAASLEKLTYQESRQQEIEELYDLAGSSPWLFTYEDPDVVCAHCGDVHKHSALTDEYDDDIANEDGDSILISDICPACKNSDSLVEPVVREGIDGVLLELGLK